MSEFAFADGHADRSFADRRQHVRRRNGSRAELILRDQPAHRSCRVLDESDGGVLVESEPAQTLPAEAIIKFSDSASQLVRRCWAAGNRAGYQFIEIVPVQRHLPQDDPDRPDQVDILALNNFVAVSRTLLNLFVTTPNALHSIETVCAQLSRMPAVQIQLPQEAENGEWTRQLLTVPQTANAGFLAGQAGSKPGG